MIQVSDKAAKQIGRIKEDDSIGDDKFLRVEVVTGGCSGLSYEMRFESGMREGDKVFEHASAKIVIDPKSYLYVAGTVLEYEGGLNGKGFVFTNPNATKTCSCGISFSVKGLKAPEKATCNS